MSLEAIKQDFESALVKHFSFKARLRSFLHGNSNEQGPLRDPDQCSLGQWIAERRQGAYQHLPEMSQLDLKHRLIHQQANLLMDYADQTLNTDYEKQQVRDLYNKLMKTWS